MIHKHKVFTMGVTVLTVASLLAGCGSQEAGQKAPVAVNTYKVTAEDTPVRAEYSGTVIATDKVPVRAKISGRVVEKYVQGGQQVTAGQPLFRIDSREYDAALENAKANRAQAAANLANQQLNLRRYQQLVEQDAISVQTLTDQEAATRQQQAVLEANDALVQSAQDNVDDTIVYAPFSGKLNVDDVAVGTYATAGQTDLVTISTLDPVYVEFSVSEAEYLQMMKKRSDEPGSWGDHLQLRLSDGSMYAYEGHVVQINHGMDGNSGSIIIKAQFENPQNLLIPGLYATVVSDTQVQQTLGRYFVSVIDSEGKAQNKPVTPGQKVGKFWIINEGISDGDLIIVDGYQKATGGATLDQHLLTKAEIESGSDIAVKTESK